MENFDDAVTLLESGNKIKKLITNIEASLEALKNVKNINILNPDGSGNPCAGTCIPVYVEDGDNEPTEDNTPTEVATINYRNLLVSIKKKKLKDLKKELVALFS